MLASAIMTHWPVTGTTDMTLQRASATLRRGHFRHLPIVDAAGELIGVISDRDLQRATSGGTSPEATVGPLVHAPAITASPETPVEQVARLMHDHKIGCVPIVVLGRPAAGGRLVGIVSESDVFRALVRAFGVGEPGSRVVVRLDDAVRDLAQVASVLGREQATLLALSSQPLDASAAGAGSPEGGAGSLRLVLRLGTIDPRPVAGALRAAGLVVESPDDPTWPAEEARATAGDAAVVATA